MDSYDPFAPGPHRVEHTTFEAHDPARGITFPCDVWRPAPTPGTRTPLVAYSHHSGGSRRTATFLTTHLASHGYTVAALDHSEIVAPSLQRRDDESDAGRAARADGIVANRVPDLRFLIDHMLAAGAQDPDGVAAVGHSLGGWAVLAAPDSDPRIRAVIAFAPGGSTHPKPGVLRAPLKFDWGGRDVPTLILAAEYDVPVPLDDVIDVFERVPSPKRMFTLLRADHSHFADNVEETHEAIRAMTFPGEAAWMPAATRPIAELATGAQAHTFARGLALAHLDATLRGDAAAARFLAGDVEAALAARGVEALAHPA
jgi:predicted dienelactone hydrolase